MTAMNKRCAARRYFLTVSYVLMIVAAAKCITAFGSAKMLDAYDPLFLIRNRLLYLLVGIVEFGIAGLCLSCVNEKSKAWLVLWLALSFVAYRFFLIMGGAVILTCPCLGSITDWLPVSKAILETGLWGIIVLMLSGSLWILASKASVASGAS